MFKLILFLVINFAALGIGGILIGNPSTNEWYQSVNKAPWTPPGWMFGFAWTTIMLCFSIFLFQASNKFSFNDLKVFYILFTVQWILNILWNPIFFRFHFVFFGLIIIILLTLLVGWFFYWGIKEVGHSGFFVLPYFIWLLIATSLNAYIYFKN
ncbi:MAG: TspO/MBR family protein [Bacteroidota bacterium]|nr:TspO/MBR family protein [Bacteroidota bacterium]MDP3145438.1 TspO/MBR family protein [Bacteroidota bacterium]